MTTFWARLEGDTSRFAMGLSFQADPEPVSQESEPYSASWGAFQIWVDGQNLCHHSDQQASVEWVQWYLLPMIEWFAENWDPIFHEQKLPTRVSAADGWSALHHGELPKPGLTAQEESDWSEGWDAWWRRHGLFSARAGGPFPDICFRRWLDWIEVSWGYPRIAGVPSSYRFSEQRGYSRVPVQEVAGPLHRLLSDATNFLVERLPEDDTVRATAKRLASLRESNALERYAWLAGLGTTIHSSRDRLAQLRAALADKFDRVFPTPEVAPLAISGLSNAVLMFGSISPHVQFEDYVRLAEIVLAGTDAGSDRTFRVDEFVRELPVLNSARPPYQQGYDAAERLVSELGIILDEVDDIDVERIVLSLDIAINEIDLSDDAVRAVAFAGENCVPSIFLNRRYPYQTNEAVRRFNLAHELCHLLFDRAYGRNIALASGPWAPRDLERRANAFAAMLLMPREVLARVVRTSTLDSKTLDGVAAISSALRTSLRATLEHMRNLDFLDEDEKERIELDLAERTPG